MQLGHYMHKRNRVRKIGEIDYKVSGSSVAFAASFGY